MNELDNKISDLESQLTVLYSERQQRMGIAVGEHRIMSADLLTDLRSRKWWTDENERDYNPFKIHSIVSENEISIRGENGGIANVSTSLVMGCERVNEINA